MSKNAEGEPKPVLFLAGGTMSGIFTVGVLKRLVDEGFTKPEEYFEAIYTSSGGAINGSTYLTGQIDEAIDGYTKDMTEGFISTKRTLRIVWQRLWWKRAVKKGQKSMNIVDIDYLMEHLKTVFDIDAIKKAKIPIYASLFDIKTGQVSHHDIRKDPYTLIKGAIAIAPYYADTVEYQGKQYVDGCIGDPVPLERMLDMHKGRIILVLNRYWKWAIWKYIRSHIEAFFSWRMYGWPLCYAFIKMEKKYDVSYENAIASDRVTVITPPIGSKAISQTTDPKILKETLQMGYDAAEKIVTVLRK